MERTRIPDDDRHAMSHQRDADVAAPVEVVTASAPDAAVIWLHGLGADGHDFEPVVSALELPAVAAIRFVFPHAPYRSVTINQGHVMRAWYDIHSISQGGAQDVAGIRESDTIVHGLIRREIERGIASTRIVLAGFSQGGAMTLFSGLRYAQPLAGLLALSCYLPVIDELMAEAQPANAATPIFLAHGRRDSVVPFALGKTTCDTLQQLDYPVEFADYDIAHTVSIAELADIARWLRRCLEL